MSGCVDLVAIARRMLNSVTAPPKASIGDENASCEFATGHAPLDQVYRFDECPSAQAERLRKQARGTPPGVKRDQLLRRARQIENAARVQDLLNSPGPKPPA
jgi:hypothetical protein